MMLMEWSIGIPAFWTRPLWQDFPCKPVNRIGLAPSGKVENGVKYVRGNALRLACIFGIWKISTIKHWPGSTPPPTHGCMALLERFPLPDSDLRDCSWQIRH